MLDHEDVALEVRERFGDFLTTRVEPGAMERDRTMSTFPPEILREAAEIGLIGYTAPREVGGGGNSWCRWGHVLEEVGYLGGDEGEKQTERQRSPQSERGQSHRPIRLEDKVSYLPRRCLARYGIYLAVEVTGSCRLESISHRKAR